MEELLIKKLTIKNKVLQDQKAHKNLNNTRQLILIQWKA